MTKFGYSKFSIREVIIILVLLEFHPKHLFQVAVLVQVQSFETGNRCSVKIVCHVVKRSKLKTKKFWALVPTFVDVTGEKKVEAGLFVHPQPYLNRVNI